MLTLLLIVHFSGATGSFVWRRFAAAFDRGMNYTPNSLATDLLWSLVWEIPTGFTLVGMLLDNLRKSR